MVYGEIHIVFTRQMIRVIKMIESLKCLVCETLVHISNVRMEMRLREKMSAVISLCGNCSTFLSFLA